MSTTPEESQAVPAPEHDFDELTGVYGFFRRHQKKLLYTAGLFTLLTFSITGSMTGLVDSFFRKDRELASIVVNGETVKLTNDDYTYGSLLARNYQGGVPYGVMLQVLAGEGGDSELGEVFAIMRRAAIAEGIEPSLKEVDRAIEATRELSAAESASKLAVSRGFGSLAEYRQLVAEAMRVGVYTRLQLLALDTSDAEVMRQLLLYREKVSFKVATYDEQARQDEMKEKSELSDDDLKEWLDGQNEMQKVRMSAFDLPTVQLRFAALLLAEGQFNPEEWADSVLDGFEMNDDQLATYYEAEKELFKIEGGDEYRSFEEESVKAQLTRMVQAERVMIDLNTKLKAAQLAVVQPKSDVVATAQNEVNAAQEARTIALKAKMAKEREVGVKDAELAKDPENAELVAAVAALNAELEILKVAFTGSEEALTAKTTALELAGSEEETARIGFDFAGEFKKLVEGKSGFVEKSLDKLVTAETLKDLDALDLELGTWGRSMVATSLRSAGSIGNSPARTSKAVVIYQSVAMESQPLKPWDVLKPLCEEAYYSDKAVAEGREKRKAMEDALLRLAKEKMPEFLAKLEKDRQGRADAKVAEWEAGVTADIAAAKEMLKTKNLGNKPRLAWQSKLDRKEKELQSKEMRVGVIGGQVDREIEAEIKEEAIKHYHEVVDAAAKEVGYTITSFGPYPRNLTQRPRFDNAFDPTVVFTFLQHSDMKQDEAVGPITDDAERRSHVIVCTGVEPLVAADITRREFQQMRKFFDKIQQRNGQQQAFTKDALEARYQIARPVGVAEDAAR